MGNRNSSKLSSSDQLAKGRWIVVLFGLPFLLAGLAMLYFLTARPLLQLLAARSWPTIPCTITSSEVQTVDGGSDGDTYRVRITYLYSVNGTAYEGSSYNFLDFSSSGQARKQRIVDQYPPGSSTRCSVNPEAPSDSVLSVALSGGYFVGLFGLIFVAVGLALMVGGLRSGNLRQLRAARARNTAATAVPSTAAVSEGRELKPAGNPLGAAIMLFIFGGIWNGITFTLVYQTWGDGLFSMLFLSIFVLVGIGIICAFCYSVLAIFNPRPHLFLAPGCVSLAGTAELDYEFSGATHRIHRLRILLEGKEEARYRRGTNTVRDEHVFLRQVLLDTQDRTVITAGRFPVALPEYSMHTFTCANNKIIWSIKIKGEIARWPDVNETFEIEMLPLAK